MAAANIGPYSKLLDFSNPVDVELVESTVNVFYGSGQQDQVGTRLGWALRYQNSSPDQL
jgi:hypothetical protein